MMRTSLDVHGKLNIRLQQMQEENNTWVGFIEDQRRANDDDLGALYYVVAVIFIYGLSIVMMIASHIRKNKQDNQLRTYLKEMAKLRKDDRRDKVISKMTDIANRRQREALEAQQKLQTSLKKEALDSEAESEVCQPLMKQEANEDTMDSVFLSQDYCMTSSQHKSSDISKDKSSESSLCRNASFSDSRSPSLCDYRFSADRPGLGRARSPSFHESRRWRRHEARTFSGQDSKSVRIQDRLSSNLSDQRFSMSPSESRSPSLNEFRLSPLCGRERSSTIHEIRLNKWTKPRTLSPGDLKFQRISEIKQSTKINDLKMTLPANFHVVDEDAVL